jgi:hypothetical protein
MIRTVSWCFLLLVAVAATVVLTRQLSTPPKVAAATPELAELRERMGQLEAALQMERSRARAGAKLGVVALNLAAAKPPAEPDGSPEAAAREQQVEAQYLENQSRHYDRLDTIARSGGGAAALAQLRKNIEAMRALPRERGRVDLDVAAIDCSETLCRLEIRAGRDPNAQVGKYSAALSRGMGANLSMRPLNGERAIYYVSAPGHELPKHEL